MVGVGLKCHEYFGCKKRACIMFNAGEKRNCWDVEPGLNRCTDTFANAIKMKNKMVFCKNCLFYEHLHEISYEMRYSPLKLRH